MFSNIISDELAQVRRKQESAALKGLSPEDLSADRSHPFNERILDAVLDPRLGTDEVWMKTAVESFQQLRRSRWQDKVFAIAPLYVTSFCVEQCLYCNYRAGNRGIDLERRRLSDEQLESEVDFLIGRGIRVIELVYATDPKLDVDSISHQIRVVHKLLSRVGGGLVGINAEPFTTLEYKPLVDAGLDFAVLWQETYDPECYSRVHVGKTKKVNYEFRLDGVERMIAAGVPHVGLGVLSGLGDWRTDWYLLLRHICYLQDELGVQPSILGIPRMRDAAGAALHDIQHVPSNLTFEMLVNLAMAYCPDTRPFVNTRENWDMCMALSRGGGNLFTFNCSTIPGGYSLGATGYQFPTFSFDLDNAGPRATAEGLNVQLDWRFDQP